MILTSFRRVVQIQVVQVVNHVVELLTYPFVTSNANIDIVQKDDND